MFCIILIEVIKKNLAFSTSFVVNHKNGTVIIKMRADEMSRRRAVCHGHTYIDGHGSRVSWRLLLTIQARVTAVSHVIPAHQLILPDDGYDTLLYF